MIIVKLGGGLGNQLFQYACGRRLALKNNDILKLDIEAYSEKNPRLYGLRHFNVAENFASPVEIKNLRLPYGFASRCIRSFRARILRKFNIGFDPKILELKDDVYLEGFWKNESYFLDINETIREEFTPREPFSPAAQDASSMIISEICPVSIHVRRGDYVSVARSARYHGVCSQEYYRDALIYLSMRTKISRLFIFSDDIEWVKKNMTFDFPFTFVSNESIPDYEELLLMSYCKHNIIANSTFSWWAAWLNNNSNKIIIAPKRWLAKTGNDYYGEIPSKWIKM
jgi:hypothetical protein